jgi:hypothetical protein
MAIGSKVRYLEAIHAKELIPSRGFNLQLIIQWFGLSTQSKLIRQCLARYEKNNTAEYEADAIRH